MEDTMADNQFPECNAIQEGRSCTCPTCNRIRLNNMLDLNNQPHGIEVQPLADVASSTGPMVYTGGVPQSLLAGEENEEVDIRRAPYEVDEYMIEQGPKPTREEIDAFFDQQHMNNYFNMAPKPAPEPSVLRDLALRPVPRNPEQLPAANVQSPEQQSEAAQGNEAGDLARRNARSPPPQRRKGRVSKYGPNNEAPPSIYGPPFQTQPITTDMPQDEIHRRVAYNKAVGDARRTYMRAKNNAAAKRSREKKQQLIDSLSAEVDRLELRNEHMAAANRELVAAVGTRAHALEAENARLARERDALRDENDALRAQVADLTRRLSASADYPAQPLLQGQQAQSAGGGDNGGEASSPPQEFDINALFAQAQQLPPNNDYNWNNLS